MTAGPGPADWGRTALPPDPGPVTAASYIAPPLAVDLLKDALALINCVVSEDQEGFRAILSGAEVPCQLAGTLASIAASICWNTGLDQAGIAALLDTIREDVTNVILDQPAPDAGGGG